MKIFPHMETETETIKFNNVSQHLLQVQIAQELMFIMLIGWDIASKSIHLLWYMISSRWVWGYIQARLMTK